MYHALGAKVTIVELMDQIIPGADKDIVTPLMKRIQKQYEAIYLKTKVTKVEATPDGLVAHFEGGKAPPTDTFDRILVAVGRRPNGRLIGAENAGVEGGRARLHPGRQADAHQRAAHLRDRRHRRPADAGAQGDARRQGRGGSRGRARTASSTRKVIPSVAYTDPEVAWVGLTENEAKAKGVKYGKGVFPWAASGRSLSLGRDEGIDEAAVRRDDASGDRLRHRRPERGRSDRRGGARDRDGRGCRGHRADRSIRIRRCRRPSAWRPRCMKVRSPTSSRRSGSSGGNDIGRRSGRPAHPGRHRVRIATRTPGKIAVTPTKSMTNQRDLSLAYSPGVAAACMAIHQGPG